MSEGTYGLIKKRNPELWREMVRGAEERAAWDAMHKKNEEMGMEAWEAEKQQTEITKAAESDDKTTTRVDTKAADRETEDTTAKNLNGENKTQADHTTEINSMSDNQAKDNITDKRPPALQPARNQLRRKATNRT
ncbi:hypothetical protein FN846DRAFT_889953 [Sphaerosporella brunnea]|uniref:Uncharacterized protein n=1 Tax=Sphaerosporella brunnea TaxID=1250544 RepID=A0A5J5EXK9_9PEZI|nr:hypothetical protein FN846DRAFT_889953 [Sphaerosporella brunnea]